jgi:hypothetical protein
VVDHLGLDLYNKHIDSKKDIMQYTLITKTGKIMQFYIKAVAETYQAGLGGVVFGPQVLETQEKEQKTVAL